MSFLSQFDLFHEQASKLTGLDDFGTTDYVSPMKLLLADYDKHTRFNAFGLQTIGPQITGLLISRLITQQGFRTHPELSGAKIERPIVILGMPRTGSTALQNLLAKDPANQWLPYWLGNFPMPRPPRETWESNPWYSMIAQGLDQFYQANPGIKTIHPMTAAGPDECRTGIEHSFWSSTMAVAANVPEYAAWVASADTHHIYARYRRILGLIACEDKRRWLLKDPTTHAWMPQTMLDIFPDAQVVYTHRDPVSAMSSIANMMYAIRRLREPELTAVENGAYQLWLWGQAIVKTEACLSGLDPARICDVHISELNADPVGTAERIYRHFNLEVSDEALQAWRSHVAEDARAGHGEHKHNIEACGFSASDVYAHIGAYGDKYHRLYGKKADQDRRIFTS